MLYYLVNLGGVGSPVIPSPSYRAAVNLRRTALVWDSQLVSFFFPLTVFVWFDLVLFTDLQFKKYLLKVLFICSTVHL